MKEKLIFGIFFFISIALTAQDIKVTTEYPSVVNNGQQFTITYSVNAGGGEFSIPSFNGFYKLMGPQTSYSSSSQLINGRLISETSFSYVYYLQAMKEGKFVIPPALFKLKNKEYYSDSIRIEVVSQNSAATGSKTDDKAVSGDLFVNITVSRKDVYLGEPILATVKLFTKVDLTGINEIKYPAFNNFLKTDVESPPLTSLQQEEINGTLYGTGIIQKFLLYPQTSGEVTIDPVQISVLVQQKSGSSDPFFGDFFSSYQTVPRVVASQPVKINVKPLPGTRPDDFSGVVGKLDLKANLTKDSVNVNDALNFRIAISGNGNLKIASSPVINLPPDIEVYDPKITEDLKTGASGISGTRTFDYLLIPRHNGDFKIPPITYSYFDISSGKYETLKTDEFSFHAVKTGDQNTGITVFGGVSKEDVKYLGKDIRFIKSEPGNLSKYGRFLLSSSSFYSVYAFSLFAFLGILFIRRERIRRNSDLSLVKNRKAGKVAGKRLHAAALCIKNQQMDKFYEEVLKALWGYLSDKLNIPVSELSRVNAVSALSSRGVDDERIENLNSILDTCEFARFAPSSSGYEAEKIYQGASHFIRSVENTIR
jgi:hypothetical protein